MSDNINHEYDKYIDPILSDKSIWSVPSNFRKAKRMLYVSLIREGHSDEFLHNVVEELFKRWEPLYDEYHRNAFYFEDDIE